MLIVVQWETTNRDLDTVTWLLLEGRRLMILPLERRIVLLQDWKDELDFHVKLIHAWKDLLLLGDTYFVSLESDLLLSFDHLLLLSRVLCL